MVKIHPSLLPKRIPCTEKGYADFIRKRDELNSMRPEAVNNLRLAREMGDLSENGYYKAAKARLTFLDARLKYFNRLIKFAKIIPQQTDGRINIGSTVTVMNNSKKITYTIVGGYESDPMHGTISHKSPIGQALIGKKAGDSVEIRIPSGTVTFTIIMVA